MAAGTALPSMLLDSVWSVPLHAVSPMQARDQERLKLELQRLNTSYTRQQACNRSAGAPDSEVVSGYASGEIVDETRTPRSDPGSCINRITATR